MAAQKSQKVYPLLVANPFHFGLIFYDILCHLGLSGVWFYPKHYFLHFFTSIQAHKSSLQVIVGQQFEKNTSYIFLVEVDIHAYVFLDMYANL